MSLFPFSVDGLLNKGKNVLIENAVQQWFNATHPKIGRITKSQFDTAKQSFELELQLNGEPTPVQIHVKKYALIERDGKTYFELSELETSRPWLNALLDAFLKANKRQVEVPSVVKTLL